MFSKVEEYINKNRISFDESIKLLHLNNSRDKDLYVKGDFNDIYLDYIDEYQRSSTLTDPSNHICIEQGLNTIYLDGDWYFKEDVDETEFEDYCENFAKDYLLYWHDELNNHNIREFYHYIFIPSTFKERKGGFHILIFANKEIGKELRIEMQNNVKNTYFDDIVQMYGDIMNEDLETKWNKVFDTTPLYQFKCLLPFAVKKPKQGVSRQYKFIETSYDGTQDYFLIPRKQTRNTIRDDEIDVEEFEEEKNVDDELFDSKETDSKDDSNDSVSTKYGSNVKLILDFLDSLMYIRKEHKFWSIYNDHGERFSKITTTFVKMVILNGLMSKKKEFSTVGLKEVLLEHFKPFIISELKNTSSSHSESEAIERMSSDLDTSISHQFQYINIYKDIWLDAIERRSKSKLTDKKEEKEDDDSSEETNPTNKEEITVDKAFEKMQHFFNKTYRLWTEFVLNIFGAGITDEIKPFIQIKRNCLNDPRHNVTFDAVQPAILATSDNESFYTKTMRIWVLMLLICSYCNTNHLLDSIRTIVTSFMRYFIWTIPNPDGSKKIYIYNIHQTKSLMSLPYNQWVLDVNNGNNVRRWIETIYLSYIKPELETVSKQERLIPFIRTFIKSNILIRKNVEFILCPFDDFAKSMDTVCRNVLCSFINEHYNPPKQLDPASSPYFPMRNGMLEFINGRHIFHTNNRDKFMDGYTNIEYVDNYDTDCQEYREVKEMIMKIYPIEEEREYMLYMYASVLNGSVTKDLFVELYGSGGDGKTTISNAIQSMLGNDGMKLSIEIEENGHKTFIENPCGLSASMKTEAILTSNTGAHDEGGRIQLLGKRFCSVQEPDTRVSGGKLNCASIKELLSGTKIVGRKIYQSSVSFSPNCLITLQTNILLGYSEDNDAVRRRMCVVHHHSKFSTSINEARAKNLRYSFQADPNLNNKITNNPKYWQALFYILLPYADRLSKEGWTPVSNIPRPDSIIKMTNDSFDKSNGLISWLKPMLRENETGMICIKTLVDKIINTEKNDSSKIKLKLVSGNDVNAKRSDAYKQLMSHFIGDIYRLQDKCYKKDENEVDDDLDLVIEEDDWKRDDLIAAYFQPKAAENMEVSITNDCSDMYLIGYSFKNKV